MNSLDGDDINLRLARLFAPFGNSTCIALIRQLAKQGDGLIDHLIVVDGLSPFTVKQNLQYLMKYHIVLGSITKRHMGYRLNWQLLEKISSQLMDFFGLILSEKDS